MSDSKKQKTTFGLLLTEYRERRGLSQLTLERLLWKDGYFITNGLVNRYESGKRRPTAGFIKAVSKCLELTEEEFQALVDARMVDENTSFHDELLGLGNDRKDISPEQSKSSRLLKIFLCHSSEDKPTVRYLYQRLQEDGFEPWLDEEALLAGQDWDNEIQRAVRNTDVVIVCISKSSITKAGYVQKEIIFALDVADKQPENTIFIIPMRIEDCDVPDRLRRLHWVDLFQEQGYKRLVQALIHRSGGLGIQIPT